MASQSAWSKNRWPLRAVPHSTCEQSKSMQTSSLNVFMAYLATWLSPNFISARIAVGAV